ncbi:MAG: M23 family metallopeptidase [Clostridia bacterium]|nr:M23 family metallopeptidase [Clostridia bacterium]
MKSILTFLKVHSYSVFVTALVLALGLISWRLRSEDAPASAEQPLPTVAPVPSATSAPTATPVPERRWQRPASGGLLTEYSDAQPAWNASMDCWQCHTGVDLAAGAGETICAAADGQVLSIAEDPLLGLTLQLDHGEGWVSTYSSLAQAQVRPGDRVRAGDVVGVAGNSADSESLLGVHLHFELAQYGLPMKPAFQP